MRTLSPIIRAKAISIADGLLDERYRADQAVTIAIAQAEHWADNQAENFYHVMPHPDGWVIRHSNGMRPCLTFATQDDALVIAREIAKDHCSRIVIHNSDGKIHRRLYHTDD
jgi:hypothetical protein